MLLPDRTPAAGWLEKLEAARNFKKWPIAKLVSLFENTLPDSKLERHQIISYMAANPEKFPCTAKIIGITGTPGAGKSSLIAELCDRLTTEDEQVSVAVLAVDPSSQVSGGSILGDRTRMHSGRKQPRLYFRSQASNLELGGITHSTFQVTRLLRYWFDYIIIETVGIGQSEIDIQQMTDHTFLVMQPLGGDQIQFMKCGIMEIPDSFIVNKCDEESLARRSYYLLRSALKQARLIDLHSEDDYKQSERDHIFLTSAANGIGIDALIKQITELKTVVSWPQCELFYLNKYIARLYGEFGLNNVETNESFNQLALDSNITYENKESVAIETIKQKIMS